MCSLHHWTISVSPTRLSLSLFCSASLRFFDGIDTNFLFSFFWGVGVIWSVMCGQKHANVQNRDQHKNPKIHYSLTHSLCATETQTHIIQRIAAEFIGGHSIYALISFTDGCLFWQIISALIDWIRQCIVCNNHQSMSSMEFTDRARVDSISCLFCR